MCVYITSRYEYDKKKRILSSIQSASQDAYSYVYIERTAVVKGAQGFSARHNSTQQQQQQSSSRYIRTGASYERKASKHTTCNACERRHGTALSVPTLPCGLKAGTAPMQARHGTGTRTGTAAQQQSSYTAISTGLAECRCSF